MLRSGVGWTVTAVAVTALVAAALLLPRGDLALDLLGDDHRRVEPVGRFLPLPPPGEAIPAWLDDGHPVFVTQEPDGTVHVLEAMSGHLDRTPMLAWCSRSGVFEEPRYGSRFDLGGRWLGGPSATGMVRFEVRVDRARGGVHVGDEAAPPGRREELDRRGEVGGPPCLSEGAPAVPDAPVLLHTRGEGSLRAVEDAVRADPGWHTVDAFFDADRQRVCALGRALRDGCPPGSLRLERGWVELGRHLAVVEVDGVGGITRWATLAPPAQP